MKLADKKAIERYAKKIAFARTAGSMNVHETKAERDAAIQRAKDDPRYCVERYFPHYATAECADFQIKFAWMVNDDPNFTGFAKWGRGLAKSVWNNVIIPFWQWLREGSYYFVLIGHNAKKAAQLLEDLRAEFEANPRIIADFGEQINIGSWKEELWVTKGGFIGQCLGFGESCRGLRVGPKRPNHYNIDDIETRQTIKSTPRQDEMVEWVESELLPSMDGASERLIFSNNWFAPVMFLRKVSEKHPDWVVHEVCAYDPVTYEPIWKAKYTAEYYRRKEKKMGRLAALAEYCHQAKKTGKIFTSDQIQWTPLLPLNHYKIIISHWDVAYGGTSTSDFNAVRIWGLTGENFHMINCFVKQSKMRDAIAFMCDVHKRLPSTVVIHWRFEAQFWNDEVKRTLKEVQKEYGVNLNIVKVQTPKVNKYDRILKLQPYYQNGRIYYNEKLKSHADTQVGLDQLYGIEPNYTTHEDAPDADEQAISEAEKYVTYSDDSSDDILTGRMEPNHARI